MVDRDNMASVHMAMPFVITQNSQREWLGENDVLIAPAYSFMILTKAFALLIQLSLLVEPLGHMASVAPTDQVLKHSTIRQTEFGLYFGRLQDESPHILIADVALCSKAFS